MAHEVPPLPYDYNALEPHIDEQTMRLHHDKHHQAYVDNLNAALAGTDWADKPVEDVLQNLDSLPEDKRMPVRNNGGGHWNHTLFWQLMSPDGGGEPDGALKDAIDQAFGDVDTMKQQVNEAGVKRFVLVQSQSNATVSLATVKARIARKTKVRAFLSQTQVQPGYISGYSNFIRA